MQFNSFRPAVILGTAVALMSSCAIAPVSTHYESARSLKKNNLEASANYSHYRIDVDGETDAANDNFGLRVGYGITDRMDVKLRYERLLPSNQTNQLDIPVNYWSFVPKYTFIDNILAVKFGVNSYVYRESQETSSEEELVSIQSLKPSVIGTWPINQKVELSLAGSYEIALEDDYSNFIGFSLGAGFSEDLDKWAVRPEVGYIFNDENSSNGFLNVGIGLTYNFDLNK